MTTNEELQARIAELETELAKTQQVLETSERNQALFQGVVDNSPMAVFVKDTNGKYLLVNRMFLTLIRREREDVIGKTDYDMYPVERADTWRETEQQVLETGIASKREDIVQRPDGTRIYLAVKFPLHNEQGNIYALGGFSTDVTEQRQAEVERDRLQQELIQAQQEVIQELSVPIIPVMDQIIVLPLIGDLDGTRAQQLMRTLLAGIGKYRAKVVILDITGVQVVDTSVAAYLDRTVHAARLKGAQTIITGISDEVAETIIGLGIDWSATETLPDLQTGLMAALNSLGINFNMKKEKKIGKS
jgi:anti-anti-sigma factor